MSSFSCSSDAIPRGTSPGSVLTIEPTLFGDAALVRPWDSLGTQGRRRLDLFRENAIASAALETWLARKIRRGYRLSSTTAA